MQIDTSNEAKATTGGTDAATATEEEKEVVIEVEKEVEVEAVAKDL